MWLHLFFLLLMSEVGRERPFDMLFTKTLLFLSVVATAAQGLCGPPPPPGMLPGWDWSSPMSASQILNCVTSSTANSYDTNERPTVD